MIRTILFSLFVLAVASAQIPYGKEFQVNSGYIGTAPDVAALTDGGFVVCWQSDQSDLSYTDIFAQHYSADGKALGGEFRVNSYTKHFQWRPTVTGLLGGGFVVCWCSYGQDGSWWGIYAQRYAANGKMVGSEFCVNSYTDYDQDAPNVASLSDGGFVVCWQSLYQDGSEWGVYAQRYGVGGAPVGGEFQVNSYIESYQWHPYVSGTSEGGFVVCWESFQQDNSEYGIFAQRFGADGTPVGEEFQANSYTDNRQSSPSVTGLSGGGFVTCWDSAHQDGSEFGIYGKCYGADGTLAGGEFQVNSYSNDYQGEPTVTGLVGGGFAACWQSLHQDGSEWGIYAQRYGIDDKPVGGEFRINNYTKGNQMSPHVAGLSSGEFVVCWESEGQDGSRWRWEIFAKRFPAEPLRHKLRPFALLEPKYDATVTTGKPILNWQPASALTIAYPWELEYTVYCDTLADFSTASFKATGPDTTVKLPALQLGRTYFWKVLAKTYNGDSLWSEPSAFFVSHTATGVEAEAVPGQFAVLSNYPNPFNPSTTIRFELPSDGVTTLKIYDLSGRLVKTLLSRNQTAGTHTAVWDGADDAGCKVAAGVYFYKLEFTDASGTRQVLTQKMSLVK